MRLSEHSINGMGMGMGMGARVRRNMEIGSTKDPIHILGTNEEINMLENRNTIKNNSNKTVYIVNSNPRTIYW